MIRYIKGDITKSDCDIICHQVNCQGVMNSGVAKAIREKWPEVYNKYRYNYEYAIENKHPMLGNVSLCRVNDKQIVINMFSQENYGYDGARYTSYDAFMSCLHLVKNILKTTDTIAFPYKIGCVRGGANWKIIRAMIEEVFQDRKIYYYYLNEKDLDDDEQLLIIATEMLKGATGVTINE